MILKQTEHLNKEKLQDFCREQLAQYYPAGVPAMAEERLAEELLHMEKCGAEEQFLLYHRLSKAAERSGHLLQIAGIAAGSILVFLLGQGHLNPLPAHYYCTSCGQFEIVEDKKFGIDLPRKTCPACGMPMRRDGFDLPLELIWSKSDLGIEYRCSGGFESCGFETAKAFYAAENRVIFPLGVVCPDDKKCRLLARAAMVVLPKGKTPEDYPQFAAYLSDGTRCLAGDYFELNQQGIQQIVICSSSALDAICRLQQNMGIFAADISVDELIGITPWELKSTSVLSQEEGDALSGKGHTYFDMMCDLLLAHDTFGGDLKKRLLPEEIKGLPGFWQCPICSREDVFDYLVARDWETEKATEIAEMVRKGYGVRRPKMLYETRLPKDLLIIAEFCDYLFPRCYGVQLLINTMILAKCMKADPNRYFQSIE